MMRKRLLATVVGVASFLTLLFGVGPLHSLVAVASMPAMGKQMAPTQCQSSCTNQQVVIAPIGNREEEKDKNKKPQPAEPYYLAFQEVGWSTVILISATFLLGYLRWRPPDLFKLNVQYRF